jgi:hypothetical protein
VYESVGVIIQYSYLISLGSSLECRVRMDYSFSFAWLEEIS